MNYIMNFDLNIENYNANELEEIFDLPTNYNQTTLDSKSITLKNNIINDTDITENTRRETIQFIDNAKYLLQQNFVSPRNNKLMESIYHLDTSLKESTVIDAGETNIIKKEQTPYVNSLPDKYYPGIFNPLKKRTITNNLNIDTRFRNNYYSTQSSNFLVDLPMKFSNVLSLNLSAFELPSTFYVFSKQLGNNFFWITASTDDGEKTEKGKIEIPDGNFTPPDLIDYINAFIATDESFQSFELLRNIIFTLNIGGVEENSGSGQTIVGIIDLYEGPPFHYELNFQFNKDGNPDYGTQLPLKLGWILGFRQGAYQGSLDYVSEAIVDSSGSKYFYLVIDDFNNSVNNGFFSAFNSSILNKNILARISIQGNPYNNIIQTKSDITSTPRQYFGPVDILKLQIQLLDEYGRIVHLNNIDYSFCLNMECVYDL